jgi:hypothetical protein
MLWEMCGSVMTMAVAVFVGDGRGVMELRLTMGMWIVMKGLGIGGSL